MMRAVWEDASAASIMEGAGGLASDRRLAAGDGRHVEVPFVRIPQPM
jgi:hypothetical protein